MVIFHLKNGHWQRAEAPILVPGPSPRLIETFRMAQGKIQDLTMHIHRLARSAEVVNSPARSRIFALVDKIHEISEKFPKNDYKIRVLFGEVCELSIAPVAAPPEQMRLIWAPWRRRRADPLFQLKTDARMDNAWGAWYAKQADADECLFLSHDDRLLCGTKTNVFVLIDNVWKTPPVSDGVLPGVTRARVIQNGQLWGHPVAVESIHRSALSRAKRWVVCNSVIGIQPAVFSNIGSDSLAT